MFVLFLWKTKRKNIFKISIPLQISFKHYLFNARLLSIAFFLINQAIVNDGITSVKGMISSRKLKAPPNTPIFPPKSLKKIIADNGAQMISPNSPSAGMA